jgi:HD superfamily phosphodiesterase
MYIGGLEVTILRSKFINDMKRIFGRDEKRIEHALAVLDYAEQIQAVEGGDPFVVVAAAILHDIGILEAERKYGSSAGKYQEMEGPPIAEGILKRYDVSADAIDHITGIIANHHSARDIDTIEFRIIWDADWLVNIPADFSDADDERRSDIVNKVFKTREGYRIAKKLFMTS